LTARNTPDSGYLEALTVFWVCIVKAFCKGRQADRRLAAINEMMETLRAGMFRS